MCWDSEFLSLLYQNDNKIHSTCRNEFPDLEFSAVLMDKYRLISNSLIYALTSRIAGYIKCKCRQCSILEQVYQRYLPHIVIT